MSNVKEIKIGNLKLKSNVFMAPLAGISDKVYRLISVKAGAGLVFSEMISVAGLARQNKNTFKLLEVDKKERPLAIQLFGNKPEEFLISAEILTEKKIADVIDINMGCPVKKVVQSGSGSALLKDLKLVKDIIQAVVNKTHLPVTVKFRSGWDEKSINYLELGKLCEREGVAAVILHPRTKTQAYKGRSDWTKIKILKESLKIPVIGNGDIKTLSDANSMFETTGCDAIMLGRSAIGNPWLIKSIIENKEITPTAAERISKYLEHVKKYLAAFSYKDHEKAVCEMRKFGARYISDFSGAAELRQRINQIKNFDLLEELLLEFIADQGRE